MQEDRIANLPNEALYHLLTVSSLKQAVAFERVLGKSRADVLRQARKFFAQKYGFPELSLAKMHRLSKAEDVEEAAILALSWGDFPEYINSISEQLESTK